MNYAVIATLGPSSDRPQTWQAMLAAGASAFRLNTSHLTIAQLSDWLERIAHFLASVQPPIPMVLDLQGSKWRLGNLPPAHLEPGQRVELVFAAEATNPGVLPVPHADFFAAAQNSDGEIVLNDARVRLLVEGLGNQRLVARVSQAGPVAANKGITFQHSDYRNESLSEKDAAIFDLARAVPDVRFALSYVKDGVEMAAYRRAFGQESHLIAKIERGPAIDAADQIAAYADEMWVCRGDLGAELGLRGMAEAVARYSAGMLSLPVPSVMAGQVLEHMTAQDTPTRSEVCYLFDCLQTGYRGFVLSDETAVGKDPAACCRAAAMWRR